VPARLGEPLDETQFAVIADMPVNSLVTAPAKNFTHEANGALDIRGFAGSGRAARLGRGLGRWRQRVARGSS
jgi:hypothetical protein